MPVTAVYARASKDDEDKRVSCGRQVERCRQLAENLFPGQPIMVFEDNDMSGADPNLERPDYNKMLAAIRRGDVAQVVTHEQSRLTRQPRQWEELVVALTMAGIAKVHTVQQGAVSVDEGNRLVGSIMALIDAEEVARAKARGRAAKEQIRTEGRPGGGPPPFGYRIGTGEDDRPELVIVPDEADAVRRISDAICDGHSLGSIAARLNDDTMPAPPPRRAKQWTDGGLHSLMLRPSLAGLRSRTVKAGHGREEIIGPARWEPILTEERWRQTLDALGALTVTGKDGKTYMVRRSQPHRPNRWLLSTGLARCGACGTPMGVGSVPRRTQANPAGRQYRCQANQGGCAKTSIGSAEQFEAYVYDQLIEHLVYNPERLPKLDRDNPERDRLEEGRRRAQRAMDEALVLLREEEIDAVQFRELNGAAKTRFARFQEAIDALPVPDTEVPDVDAIRNRWDELPLARKQKALTHYIKKVTVGSRPGGRIGTHDPKRRMERRVKIDWKA